MERNSTCQSVAIRQCILIESCRTGERARDRLIFSFILMQPLLFQPIQQNLNQSAGIEINSPQLGRPPKGVRERSYCSPSVSNYAATSDLVWVSLCLPHPKRISSVIIRNRNKHSTSCAQLQTAQVF